MQVFRWKEYKERYIQVGTFLLWIVLLAFIVISIAKGQTSPNLTPSSLTLSVPPPLPVQGVNANVIGPLGQTKYLYFVVAKYQVGNAAQSVVPAIILTGPNNLSATNYNSITWQGVPNAIGYDVLRIKGSDVFLTPCTNCLVASNITSNSVLDQNNTTLGNYTLISAPGASILLALDNVTGPTPRLTLTGNQFTQFFPTTIIGVNHTNSGETLPFQVVNSLPATCDIYSVVWLTSAIIGNNIYICNPVNIWTGIVATSAIVANNALTANALTPTPGLCSAGSAPQGITAQGNPVVCTPYTQTIGSGITLISLGITSIAAGACTITTVSVPNVTVQDIIIWTPAKQLETIVGYKPIPNGTLTISAYPVAGSINFSNCNPTAASITPGATPLNWRVVR
jgi:hypothetical protein